jgi:methyl-accepting chemotaxis protein
MTDHRSTRPSEDQRLLRESLDLVAPAGDELIAVFHDRLFTSHPELRAMFPAVLDTSRERLLQEIIAFVTYYDHPRQLLPTFAAMGRRHERYGVGVEHYAAVGAILIRTLRDFAGTGWTPAHQDAWVRAYTFAAGNMMQAGALAEEEDDERLAA